MPWLRSFLVLVLASGLASAGDWPQWLGPNRDNSSPETVVTWKEPPKVLWRQPVGEGNSSPVVAGGRVFSHAKIKDKNEEEVVAYDAKSGKELWRYPYKRDAFTSFYGNGPRATPAVVDGKVYTFGITGVLTCLEAASGKQVWQVDTLKRFEEKNLVFGLAASPLIEKDYLLLNVGSQKAVTAALDRKTGEVAWKTYLTWKDKEGKPTPDTASYASPIIIGEGAQRQAIFLTGRGVASLDPATGKVFWQFPMVDALFESSTTPVKVGERLFVSSITYGGHCLRLESKDGKPAYKDEWKNPDLSCYFSTPVAVGKENLYVVTGRNPLLFKAEATLRCVEMSTGKALWSKPNIGQYHAALLRTGDNKLLLLDDKGHLALLEPDPKQYKELCRSPVCGPTWAHPALADGLLYVRDDKELICLQLGQ